MNTPYKQLNIPFGQLNIPPLLGLCTKIIKLTTALYTKINNRRIIDNKNEII
jgi:hypothetical protein